MAIVFRVEIMCLNDVHLGETYVDTGSSTVLWSEWKVMVVYDRNYGGISFLHRVSARDGGFIELTSFWHVLQSNR